jgi:hypothetical protein
MKLNHILIILISALLIISACKKEEEKAAPTINSFEIGSGGSHGDEHKVHRGEDMHFESEIYAEGKVQRIILIIHPEGEGHKDGDEWEVDTTYTEKYARVINVEFHEHIDVPITADTGHYHVDFTVIDESGKSTYHEDEVEILLEEK